MITKGRVILIQACVIEDSPRLIKEVEVLEQNGYSVTLLGWDREGEFSSLKQKKGKGSLRKITLKIMAPKGIGVFPFLLVWWCFELFWLIRAKYDCIHVINFNSVIPAVIVGGLKNKRVIYEVLDTQTDWDIFPRIVRHELIQVDKMFMWLADAIILVDEMQIEEFGGINESKVIVVYDSPPDVFHRMDFGYENERDKVFTIFYAGKLNRARRLNLDKIFTAISDINDVRIVIAGYGDLDREIEEWAYKMPEKITFIGRISYVEVLERSIKSNLLFSIRDPLMPTHKYICGCKMLEAMMCGKPILVSKGTSTAIKVSKAKCGIVIDANNTEEIKRAIVKLKENRVLCRKLGANGRKAYKNIYGWEIMKQRLLSLYSKILNKG